jgi:hypothetical protein
LRILNDFALCFALSFAEADIGFGSVRNFPRYDVQSFLKEIAMLRNVIAAVVAIGLFGPASLTSLAADQDRTRDQDRLQTQDGDRIYGSQLMTDRERDQYRDRMRSAKTEQDRERIRSEHHERMKVRARERGVSLPDDPPSSRGGTGPGPGMGSGMGSGTGGGGGGGRGR